MSQNQNLTNRVYEFIAQAQVTSRAEIAKALQIAPSTASIHVQHLLDKGKISESGAASSTGGRRATKLTVDTTSAYYLLADLGTSHYRFALSDATGAIHHAQTKTLKIDKGPETCLTAVVQSLAELLQDHAPEAKIAGIVLGLPAPIDYKKGRPVSASHMPGWNGFPVAKWLQTKLQAPVVIENDANLTALGEHSAHKELAHSITITVGSGIATGMVINGKLYRGATGAAGEISHLRHQDYGSLPCSCGNTGCLETVASAKALEKLWQAAKTTPAGEHLDLITACKNGDPEAGVLVKAAGERVGTALCATTSLFNPEHIFVAGKLSTLDTFIAAVRSEVYGGCHPLLTKNLQVDAATSGPDAGLLGAAQLALQVFGQNN